MENLYTQSQSLCSVTTPAATEARSGTNLLSGVSLLLVSMLVLNCTYKTPVCPQVFHCHFYSCVVCYKRVKSAQVC